MDFVTPKKIMSPYSGEFSTPKIVTRDYPDKVVVEAQWYCPASGKFITKGIVRIDQKRSAQQD